VTWALEIGNENVLSGIELRNDVTDFYKKISSNSSRECQAECKNRFFCRAWFVFVFLHSVPRIVALVIALVCGIEQGPCLGQSSLHVAMHRVMHTSPRRFLKFLP